MPMLTITSKASAPDDVRRTKDTNMFTLELARAHIHDLQREAARDLDGRSLDRRPGRLRRLLDRARG
jgi:GAF domain-containing protein